MEVIAGQNGHLIKAARMKEILTTIYEPGRDIWLIVDGRTRKELGACYAGPGEILDIYGGKSHSEALRAYLDDVEELAR